MTFGTGCGIDDAAWSIDPEAAAPSDGADDRTLFEDPIEAQFGPLRTFTMGGSDHQNQTVLARRPREWLAWRNANARHPEMLGTQRRERARVRSERQQRRGRPRPNAA